MSGYDVPGETTNKRSIRIGDGELVLSYTGNMLKLDHDERKLVEDVLLRIEQHSNMKKEKAA